MTLTNFKGWKILETQQSKELIYELVQCKSYQRAAILISETGCGKTETIKTFQKARPDNTYTLTVGDSYRLIDVIDELLALLGIENGFTKHMINAKLKLIAAKLKQIHSSGGKIILIFDEAENLKVQVLKALKELYDAVIKYCSIVLIGTEQIMDAILNKRNKNRQSVPQLYRRFKAGIRTITKINKARDFKPFFDLYIPKETDVQDLLLQHCENYGELHDYLEPVLVKAAEKNIPVSAKLFLMVHHLPALRKTA